MLETAQQKLHHHTRSLLAQRKLLWRRIDEDHMTTLAGNLIYMSLLSPVPLIATVFTLFIAFPVFSKVSMQIRHFIFASFTPMTGGVIQRYIKQFVANFSRMAAVGAFSLVVTSLLLMYLADGALNTIWRNMCNRPKVYSFAIYWAVLIPNLSLASASLTISSYLLLLHWASDLGGVIDNLLRPFPLVLSWATFWLLYNIVPTTQVHNRDAMIGTLAATLPFKAGKKAFALYTIILPSYQLICGIISVVSILFVQVYWAWCIVLPGAEITVTLNEYCKLEIEEAEQPWLH